MTIEYFETHYINLTVVLAILNHVMFDCSWGVSFQPLPRGYEWLSMQQVNDPIQT